VKVGTLVYRQNITSGDVPVWDSDEVIFSPVREADRSVV